MTTVKQLVKQAKALGLESTYKPHSNSYEGERDQFSAFALINENPSHLLIYFSHFEGDKTISASFNMDVSAPSSGFTFPVSAFMNMTVEQMADVVESANEMRAASEARENKIKALKEEGNKARATFRKSWRAFFLSNK
jgi:hypothetical protein